MLCFSVNDRADGCYGLSIKKLSDHQDLKDKKTARTRKMQSIGSAETRSYDEPYLEKQTQNHLEGGQEGTLELVKITDRLAALLFPTNGPDGVYRAQIKSASERVKRTYEKYKIFNVSQKRSDLGRANPGAVLELGWPDQLAPPLDRLCSICKQIENFLFASPGNIVIIHCKGSFARAGVIVAAYLTYTTICGSGEESMEDRFSMQLFAEKYLSMEGQPSHRRYLRYFSELLSGTIKVYQAPLLLTHISLRFLPKRKVLLKIYERMKPVWISGIINLKELTEVELILPSGLFGLSLRGDVLLKCFDTNSECFIDEAKYLTNSQQENRTILFQCQFNTCALNFKHNGSTRFLLPKDQIDFLCDEETVNCGASIEMCFATESKSADKTPLRASPRAFLRHRSASPGKGNHNQVACDFSHADSYENFERIEDDRSTSAPLPAVATTLQNASNAAPLVSSETSQIETDRTQSSESTKESAKLAANLSVAGESLPRGENNNDPSNNFINNNAQAGEADGADSGIGSDSPKAAKENHLTLREKEETNYTADQQPIVKTPPEVPPKPVNSSEIMNGRRGSLTNYENEEFLDPDDPLRASLEDSTIGRDHSVLPPGARQQTKRNDATTGGSGSESDKPPLAKPSPATHNFEHNLVVKGRYDPNSRCFSYVPVKSLKEHYSAPKKPPSRRVSTVEPADIDEMIKSPEKMTTSLHNVNFPIVELKRRAETPKWEAEIDRVAGPIELPSPRRRASITGSSFPHPAHSSPFPSAAAIRRPGDDYFLRRLSPPSPQQSNSTTAFIRPQLRNGPPPELSKATDSYEARIQKVHDDGTRVAGGQLEMKSPLAIHQSVRSAKAPLKRSISGPPRRSLRSDMDELLDPEFYMTFSKGPSSRNNKQPSAARTDSSSMSVPSEMLPKTQPADFSGRVSSTISHHQPPAAAQNSDDYRKRNCRSVNSTPSWKDRKLFAHDQYDAVDSAEDPDDWLSVKLRELQSKRFYEPDAQKRRNTERMLLEELKNVSTQEPRGRISEHHRILDNPLEDYQREEMRLKNTQSPFVDELRIANKKLQKAMNEGTYKPSYNNNSTKQKWQQPARSISANPDNVNWSPFRSPAGIAAASPLAVRRGITPTSHLMREKPPTPPPVRDRSRSPAVQNQQNQNLKQRMLSSSVPPQVINDKQQQQQNQHDQTPAVNPNLYAIRQAMYRKERERLGISENEKTTNPYAPTTPVKIETRRGNPEQVVDECGSAAGSIASTMTENELFARPTELPKFHQRVVNGDLVRRNDSPVKSILKRPSISGSLTKNSEPEQQTKGRSEDYAVANSISNRRTPLSNLPDNHATANPKTPPDYKDSPTLVVRNRADEQQRYPTGARGATNTPTLLATTRRQQDQQPQPTPTPQQELRDRSDTPAFPTSETPLPYHPLLYKDNTSDYGRQSQSFPYKGSNTYPALRYGSGTPQSMLATTVSRRSSLTSVDGGEIIHQHPVFVKDTSKYWYKPKISREEAISVLKTKPPGTFVIRDSNSFPGAFGLALKVAQPPPGVSINDGTELVRHFLIEPSNKGVRLKGCPDEPVFGTLAALVYQHSITPLALPSRLILPEYDPASTAEHINSNQALLERGAACNITYLGSEETESLTGPEALKRSASHCFDLLSRNELHAVPVHFKVSSQGITLTDNTRTMFFRRHYPVNNVTFAGVDPENRVFDNNNVVFLPPTYVRQAPIFGFVARKYASASNGLVENVCHVFAELDPDQPATAIVRFVTNVMMPLARAHMHRIHNAVQ